jgi:nitrogen-specific signal transduction histidine kinase
MKLPAGSWMKQLAAVAVAENDRLSVLVERLAMLSPRRFVLAARIGTLVALLATLVVVGVLRMALNPTSPPPPPRKVDAMVSAGTT